MNKSSTTYVLLFMLAICIVFGAGVSAVHYATRGMLEKNETLHKNRIISRAFMLDVDGKTAHAYQQAIASAIRIDTIQGEKRNYETFYRGKTTTGEVGFVFSGIGFWDIIRGIVVLAPDRKHIVNMQILEQKETPGLGARIEEAWFTDQFKGLEIDWSAPVGERIIIGGAETGGAKNRLDAITGATQTSIALMQTLNSELDSFKKAFLKKADD